MNAKTFFFIGAFFAMNASIFAQNFEPSERSICGYGRNEALTEASIKRGTVIHVSRVGVGASSSAMALGGVIGGAAVAALTKEKDWGTRSALTTLGAAAGVTVADRTAQTEGIRFLVEDKQGAIVALVAEADSCARSIAKGDTVFVARGQRTRIIRE